MLKRILAMLLVVIAAATSSQAQVTTSNIGGQVKGNNDQPIAGATVRAVHLPTGTVYSAATRSDGRFNIYNVQPGGPYTVEVTFVGFGKEVVENLQLSLGETGQVDFVLMPSNQEMTTVVVATTRRPQSVARGGVETIISNEKMQSTPTVGRNLADFIRLTPQAKTTFGGGISVAGQNNRYNQIMIDGAVNNDVFGLSETGTNGGQTSSAPISIDAIEAFQIGISPYDPALGNFTGGSINAITKSGTNNFRGSAYFITRNEDLAGKTPTGLKENATRLPDFSGKIYGFTLGGPIVKNKLFFFLSGELQRDERPQPFDPATFRVSTFRDSVNLLLSKLNSLGYDPGDYMSIPDLVNSDKLATKFTWNMSQKHRLNVSYRYTGSERFNTSASTATRINFFNNGYLFPSTTHSGSFELLSTTSSRSSNRLLVTYTDVNDDRDPLGKDFPRVTINSTNGTSYVFGTENFSTANLLKQNNFAVFDEFRYNVGRHQLKAGIDIEYSKSYNLFIRDAYGSYTYGSVQAFLNDLRPTQYARSFSLVDNKVGDGSEAAAKFNTARMAAFIGDEWNVTNNFSVNMGVRLDNFEFLTTPNVDTFFNNRAIPAISKFWDMQGARSGQRPDAQLSISPRLGLTYNIPEERLKIRAGAGFFTGRVPLVWPGGVYNNTGVNVGGVNVNNPNINFRPDPFNQYSASDLGVTVRVPSGQIDLIAKDFKLPKVLKTSFGFDKNLGKGFNWTVDLLYQKNINEIVYYNVYGAPGGKNSFGQDVYLTWSGTGNPSYNSLDLDLATAGKQNPYATGIFIISNAKNRKGYSYNFSTMLDKSFGRGFSLNAAYSFGDSWSLFDGTSSQNNSQWRFMEAVNGRNNVTLSRSDFAQLHRITALASKKFSYFNNNAATTLSLFYNGQSGSPYSYVFSRSLIYDSNGGQFETTDLIYVPKDITDWRQYAEPFTSGGVTYSVDQQWDLLNAYISKDKYLNKRRGQFVERNGAVLPFSHTLDLKLQQDFSVRTGAKRNTVSLIFDMFNFTNFLNREWGRVYVTPGFDSYSLISMEGYVPSMVNGQPFYRPRLTYRNVNNQPAADVLDVRGSNYMSSRWRGQFTVRYSFN